MKPYEAPQNLIRKHRVLRACLDKFEALRQNNAPIFRDDPLVARYIGQLQADLKALEEAIEQDVRW